VLQLKNDSLVLTKSLNKEQYSLHFKKLQSECDAMQVSTSNSDKHTASTFRAEMVMLENGEVYLGAAS
jgi:hypothetical protein